MFRWAFTFLIAGGIVAPFAFGNVRPDVAGVAQGVVAICAALFIITGAIAYDRRRRRSG